VGEQPKPFISERLAANLVCAIRPLDAADRAHPEHADVAELRDDIDAVRSQAALARGCDTRRYACLAF
jgi:hypothetical protein